MKDSGEVGIGNGPSFVCDEQLVYQPDPGTKGKEERRR